MSSFFLDHDGDAGIFSQNQSEEMPPLLLDDQGDNGIFSLKQSELMKFQIQNNDKLKCDICGKGITYSRDLKRHMKTVHNVQKHSVDNVEKNHKCETCGNAYGTTYDLIRHIERVHERKRDYKCDICGKPCYDLKEHKRAAHSFHKCEYESCDYKVKSIGLLRSHIIKQHGEMNTLCKYCGKLCDTEEELKSHFNEVHEKRKTKCQFCKKEFNNIKKHMLNNHADVDGDNHMGPRLKRPEEKQTVPCEFCGKFFRVRSMNNHVMKHHSGTRPRDYKCEICGNDFMEERSLKNHKKGVHDGIRESHPCPTCGRSYRSSHDLTKHIRKAHENRRDFICGTCNKAFFTTQMLDKHIKGVHLKQRDHACQHCGKTFFGSHDMLRHVDAVHLGKRDVWKRKGLYTYENRETLFSKKN